MFRQDEEAGVVGHIPYELSATIKVSLAAGGITLKLAVIDDQLHRSDRAGGLIIKCRYLLKGHIVIVNRLAENIRDKINALAALQQQINNL